MSIDESRKDKFEQWAKQWDDKLPNLSKALRSKDLQNSCADIDVYHGWIRCVTSNPTNNERVLVTNGSVVWIGEYDPAIKEWTVVYDGAPPFNDTEIIAWTFMPFVPEELIRTKH